MSQEVQIIEVYTAKFAGAATEVPVKKELFSAVIEKLKAVGAEEKKSREDLIEYFKDGVKICSIVLRRVRATAGGKPVEYHYHTLVIEPTLVLLSLLP